MPTTLCYLQNGTFCPIYLFISILFALCLHKPYFLLFKCKFDKCELQFETYCFYVNLETSSNIKLIYVPAHYYWLIPFSAVNSVFFLLTFSCVCQIYVADVLIIHFCNYYHLRFLSPYEYQSEGNLGSTLDQDPTPHPYLGCTLYLNLGSNLALALIPFMSHLSSLWLGVHSGPSSSPISVSPKLILGDQLQIQIQLQINILVVLFDLNVGSTLAPGLVPVPSMSHLSSLW